MQTEYNVRNLNDLLELNEEISAFLIDIEEVSGEQKVIVEAKRNSFRQRMNKNEDFVLQEKEAMFLQRKISDIYNNHIFCEIFKTTNFKEFFEFYGYEINSKNLGYAVFLYFDILNSVANCSKLTFGENNKSLCLFKLNQIININCEEQNNLILHEFVHSVDSYDGSCIVKSFADLFNFLNEALTEYLAIDSLKYLKNNILNIDNVPKERTVVSTYVCMLPLVEKLKSSCIWNDLLIAKLDGNDVEFIEKRIGYGNLKTIEECFSQTYKNMDDKQILEENSAKLDKILSKMKLRSKQNV